MDDENDPLRLDRQICFPLYAASNRLTRAYRPILDRLGLTYAQYLVMLVLWEESPQSVGSIGARLHLDSGTLTPLLKRLEAAGLVTRRRDPEDERRLIVSPTEAGAALRAEAQDVPVSLCEALGLTVDEMRELAGAVGTVTRLLRRDT